MSFCISISNQIFDVQPNIRRLFSALRKTGKIMCQNTFFRSFRFDKLSNETNPIEWLFHQIPEGLFIVSAVSGHFNEVEFAPQSHKQNQYVTDKNLLLDCLSCLFLLQMH
jgi:hypothetical protein